MTYKGKSPVKSFRISTRVNSFVHLCMVQFYLLPCPLGHTPGNLQFCFHLAVYSPPLGTQKETIPNPRDSSSTTNTLFCVQNIDYDIDFRTIAKPDVLIRT